MAARRENEPQSRGTEQPRPRSGERPAQLPEQEEPEQGAEKNPGVIGQESQTPRRSGRGSNLSDEDRARGGERSARKQQRDQFGQFAGVRGSEERPESQGGRQPQPKAPQQGGQQNE